MTSCLATRCLRRNPKYKTRHCKHVPILKLKVQRDLKRNGSTISNLAFFVSFPVGFRRKKWRKFNSQTMRERSHTEVCSFMLFHQPPFVTWIIKGFLQLVPPMLEQMFSSRENIILDINTGFVVFPSAPERSSSSSARWSRRGDQRDKTFSNPDIKQATGFGHGWSVA